VTQENRAVVAPPRVRIRWRDDLAGLLLTWLSPALVVTAWELAVRSGLVRPTILPSPSIISTTFLELLTTGELLRHLGVSLMRVGSGFLAGALSAVLLGTLIGLSRTAHRASSVLLGILRPIPVVAWVPLLILWLGIGESSKITLIAIGTFWPVLLNLVHGIRSTDHRLLEVVRVLEKDQITLLRRVIFPAAMPSLLTGIRLGMGIAWTSVIAAELLGADQGIGFLIAYARELTQVDVMFTGLLTIGITGNLLDGAIRSVERHLLRWNPHLAEGR